MNVAVEDTGDRASREEGEARNGMIGSRLSLAIATIVLFSTVVVVEM
jgi:hypothetical protein